MNQARVRRRGPKRGHRLLARRHVSVHLQSGLVVITDPGHARARRVVKATCTVEYGRSSATAGGADGGAHMSTDSDTAEMPDKAGLAGPTTPGHFTAIGHPRR